MNKIAETNELNDSVDNGKPRTLFSNCLWRFSNLLTFASFSSFDTRLKINVRNKIYLEIIKSRSSESDIFQKQSENGKLEMLKRCGS